MGRVAYSKGPRPPLSSPEPRRGGWEQGGARGEMTSGQRRIARPGTRSQGTRAGDRDAPPPRPGTCWRASPGNPAPALTRATELFLTRVPDASVETAQLEALVARLPAVGRAGRARGDGGGCAVGRGVGSRVGAVGAAALAAARLGHPLRALAPVRGEEGGGGEEQRQQVQGHGQERSAAAARLHAARAARSSARSWQRCPRQRPPRGSGACGRRRRSRRRPMAPGGDAGRRGRRATGAAEWSRPARPEPRARVRLGEQPPAPGRDHGSGTRAPPWGDTCRQPATLFSARPRAERGRATLGAGGGQSRAGVKRDK